MTDKRAERNPSGDPEIVDPDEQGSEPGGSPTDSAASGPNADMQVLIGRQLRAVFDDIAKQPVPDRFIELMRQLDTASTER